MGRKTNNFNYVQFLLTVHRSFSDRTQADNLLLVNVPVTLELSNENYRKTCCVRCCSLQLRPSEIKRRRGYEFSPNLYISPPIDVRLFADCSYVGCLLTQYKGASENYM